ncbi:hypothetical protein [Spirosoma daeguense]
MRKILLFVIFATGGLVMFIWYWTILIHWVEHIKGGFYPQNSLQTIVETMLVVPYTYLGIRFFKRLIPF